MLPGLALPSVVRQAPDHKALHKTATLVVAGQPLSTPPIAQEYFQPGVNVKHTRRSKPKTNYTLPSDMPKYELGFVPTNKASGAETGEEPPLIVVKEAKPADLMDVFARIEAEEKALAAVPKYGVDMGTAVTREYQDAKRMALLERRVDSLMREGYTEREAVSAVEVVRMEEAVKKAKEPPKPVPVEEAIQEALGVAVAAVRPHVPAAVPIDERIVAPRNLGRSFVSSLDIKVPGEKKVPTLSEVEEKKLKGRPTKAEQAGRAIQAAMIAAAKKKQSGE